MTPKMNISVKVQGLERLHRTLLALRPETRKAAAAELYRCGETILEHSLQVCPLRTGALRSTGTVTLPEEHAGSITVAVGYGGVASKSGQPVDYAYYVHENMDPGVHWSTPGTGPKYLERPALEFAPQIGPRVAKAIEAAWRTLLGRA
jgi:hypothetical protein